MQSETLIEDVVTLSPAGLVCDLGPLLGAHLTSGEGGILAFG